MSRVQLALNVSDLDEAIDFYSKLFGTAPAKVRPGYANFAVADPPLKLVLMEHADARGSGIDGALNHLGVEVADHRRGGRSQRPARRRGPGHRGSRSRPPAATPSRTRCGSSDPDGAPWEVYTVLADAPAESGIAGDGTCCVPEADPEHPRVGDPPSACC